MVVVGDWTAVHVEQVYSIDNNGDSDFSKNTESTFADSDIVVNAVAYVLVGDGADGGAGDLVIAMDPTGHSLLEIAIFENTAIPEFTTLLAPIVSVLGIVCWNYRRREAAGQ